MGRLKDIWRSTFVLNIRAGIANFRNHWDPLYKVKNLESAHRALVENLYYEIEDQSLWYPPILSLEQTLRKIIDERMSICRFGDGEFEIVAGKDMSFQRYDPRMQDRLKEILQNPLENCLCCIPNIYGSLACYTPDNQWFWRGVALRSRRKVLPLISSTYKGRDPQSWFGDPQISRAYLPFLDKSIALRVFDLWKELFLGKDILIVEGRFSRLGIGNDLLAGAKSIRRIWCPPTNAFEHYDAILAAIRRHAKKEDLVLLALGGTATILAYDLAKEGYWAVDAGHVDIEYMWMKMGVTEKTPISGRYVNECVKNGREMIKVSGEETVNHVVEIVE